MKTVVVRSWQGLDAIRREWKDRCRQRSADLDYMRNVVATKPAVVRPHVIVLSCQDEIQAIVAGWIERRPWCFWTHACEGGRIHALMVPQGGIMGADSVDVCNRIKADLHEGFRNREFEVVNLSSQATGSPIVEDLLLNTPFPFREHSLRRAVRWTAQLPGSGEEFFSRVSSHHHAGMRRLRRRLEEAFPNAVHIMRFADCEGVAKLSADAEAISHETYQFRLGGGFNRSAERMALMSLSAREQWLRGYVLYVGQRPIAFWIGTLYKNTFHLDTTGYLEEFKKYEPGTMLFMQLIEDLCLEGVVELDFGSSDAFYKARFGDSRSEEYSFWLCGRLAPTMALLAWKSICNVVNVRMRAIVAALRVEGWLRKLIRRIPRKRFGQNG